jgi:CRP/FNR family transcriptional regulator
MTHADDVLRHNPLFAALSEDDERTLAAGITTVRLDRGQVLFNEGDPGDKLYIIQSGKIKLTKAAPDGRENLLSVHGPGEMFGELSLFDPIPRTSGAVAVTVAELAGLAHDDMRRLLASRPDVAMQLLRALAQRLRRVNEVKADLVFTDVPGRVAKALLDLAERFGQAGPAGVQVTHDLTQEELAQLVGASRETVNKALADFASRGWIQLAAKSVLIMDIERLRKRSR